MQLEHSTHERKADSETAAGARQRSIHLVEQLEDVLQVFGGQADTIVAHTQHHLPTLLGEIHLDATTRVGVFGRVVEQVRNDLLETRGVTVDTHG